MSGLRFTAIVLCLAAAVGFTGCRRPDQRPRGAIAAPAQLVRPAAGSGGATTDTAVAVAVAVAVVSASPGTGAQDGALSLEEGEVDPGSGTVTVRLAVEPRRPVHVFWGAKDLGLAPLEIQRPRGSGPMDLILRSPGFLTVHTRAFTDRDDRITVRLVPETEAPRMLGYRTP